MKKNLLLLKYLLELIKKYLEASDRRFKKCVNVLNDTVDKYSNRYYNTIKMKPIDVKSNFYTEYDVDSNEKDPKFQVVLMQEFQNIKTFLLKDILVIYQKKFL